MVEVLVGQRAGTRFRGFLAQFEGDEISYYEHEGVVYTLYRVSSVNYEAYRVHISDETNHKVPTYELHPYEGSPSEGRPPGYGTLYDKRDIAQHYPLFLKDIDYFEPYPIDASRTL
jgi:hypothetical protein